MNPSTKANPSTSIADKLARASQRYAHRANHVMTNRVSGGGATAAPANNSLFAGIGGAATGSSPGAVGGLAGAVVSKISPESAREILSQRQGKLSAVLEGHLKNLAGPVK